jgi:hypothetical protein
MARVGVATTVTVQVALTPRFVAVIVQVPTATAWTLAVPGW